MGMLILIELFIPFLQIMWISFIPQNTKGESEFGLWEYKFEKKDDKVIYERRLILKEGEFSKEAYTSYRNFMIEINKLDQQKIVLTNQL